MLSAWNWTEVVEGVVVSLLFVLLPLGWRIERHHRKHAQRLERIEKHLEMRPKHLE